MQFVEGTGAELTETLSSSCPSNPSEIAQVIAPYSATGAEQLTLAPGQLILIRKKNPGGWWEGELQVRKYKLEYLLGLYVIKCNEVENCGLVLSTKNGSQPTNLQL